MSYRLNARALALAERLVEHAVDYRVQVHIMSGGGRVIDAGIAAPGGIEAGLMLAETCLAGLGRVRVAPSAGTAWQGPCVTIATDHPRLACMASQYAGWKLSVGKFFAMGSGPMRVVARKEPLFESWEIREQADDVVGVLESRQLPGDEVIDCIAQACGVDHESVTLLVAPTASLAGSLQVVARSVETALHKLHDLGFELERVVSGWGTAPLPPVAADDLAAIGRTNDAILYAGEATLWVRGDDRTLESLGPRVPSSSSADHGQPFAEIFARYDHDFYRIDPHLFSPAVVTFHNLDSGRTHRFGRLEPDVLRRSFGVE